MEFLIILLLLLLNGLFSLYEMALVSASKVRMEALSHQGKKMASRVLRQMENPEQTLSTIQIGITLIGVVSGAYGGSALADDVVPLFRLVPFLEAYAVPLAMTVTIALITYLSLVIGELVPKSIALSNPERYSMILSPLVQFVTWLCYPVVWLLSVSTRMIGNLLNISTTDTRPMTQEELKMLLQQSTEQGVINEKETEMLHDVFSFSDRRVRDLMTPYHEMVVLTTDDTREKVLSTISSSHFSKYVLEDAADDTTLGYVSVKDLVQTLSSDTADFDLRSLARPVLFVPESVNAMNAVELFKKNKTKLAVVVNEYGATEGLITLHDLTECVFGDIVEDGDAPEPEIVKRDDGSYLVDGAVKLAEFMETMGIDEYDDVDDEGFATVGGLTMYMLERLPREADTFTYRHLQFEVADMDGERVDKLIVRCTETDTTTAED